MEDWSRVYEENVHEVFRFLMFYVGNRQEAEDIVQETFLKAFVSWEKFDRRSSARTWVITIARNLAVDRLRKQQRTQMLKKLFRQETTAEREWPEEMLTQGETRRELYEAIATLKPDYRAVVVLRGIQEYSNQEVAAILGWSENKTKVTFHRAVKSLGKLLENGEEGTYELVK